MKNTKNTYLILDDHEIVSNGIKNIIENSFPGSSITLEKQIKPAQKQISKNKIDILISDLSIGDYLNGLEFIEHIKSTSPETKIIVYSMHDNASVIKKLYRIGINSYITKHSDLDEIEKALNAIHKNENYFCPISSKMLLNNQESSSEIPIFSFKEKQIIKYLKEGRTSAQIARAMRITKNTVESHRRNILLKSGCNNVAELIALVVENKIV